MKQENDWYWGNDYWVKSKIEDKEVPNLIKIVAEAKRLGQVEALEDLKKIVYEQVPEYPGENPNLIRDVICVGLQARLASLKDTSNK